MKTIFNQTSPLQGGLRGTDLLHHAMSCWQSLEDFRRERTRNKNYTYGRQWSDFITVNGQRITERDYIISEGNIPLQNNLIRRIVRNVLGVFRSRLKEKMESWDSNTIAFANRNCLTELLARTMEEFLISGLAVCRRWSGFRQGVHGEWIDYVSPESFFFDTESSDFRGWDVRILGQIHDVSPAQWQESFVRTPADLSEMQTRLATIGPRALRVVEVWHLSPSPRSSLSAHNSSSNSPHPSRWRYSFLDMEGRVLREGVSPYADGHPYTFRAYPFIDGEIHSFVHDIIDQQRYANRLITLYDWVMRASAKGVLLLPEGCVEPNNLQDVADQWGRFNGVIVYKPKAGGPEPHQVSANTANIGIGELLDIQLKMLEDVSGVTGALQGTVATNSMSGALYTQQTQNSLTALSDILDTFLSFAHSLTLGTKLTPQHT